MALLDSEAQRIRVELGYNVMGPSAEPYIHTFETLDTILQSYLTAGASTTSDTEVTAASAPTPSTLMLALVTGFAGLALVWVDVDARQEEATVQLVDGSAITLLLTKAHTGTYPVMVDGGEAAVRRILYRLRGLANELGDSAVVAAGMEQADEIRFAIGADARDAKLQGLQMYWRDQLAAALGVPNMWRVMAGASTRLEAY